MANKQSLEDRMKQNYEKRSDISLTRRTPVVIRIDGKAFHTFTRKFAKPYDEVFHKAMNATLEYLCKHIQGCSFGYTQSDEISLLLTDYDTLDTDAWFDYRIQKMCSIAASMATMVFNKQFQKYAEEYINECSEAWHNSPEEISLTNAYLNAIDAGAMFDARCFNIPKEEVCNYFISRQQDATRNAIQMLGQKYFSPKELNRKSGSDIQEMLFQQHQINFNDYPVEFKRGVCCFRYAECVGEVCSFSLDETPSEKMYKMSWTLDKNAPIFTQDREYVERCV